MDALSLFGLFAVSAMLVFYALEPRSRWFILAFAGACALDSAYGFLQGAWPFGAWSPHAAGGFPSGPRHRLTEPGPLKRLFICQGLPRSSAAPATIYDPYTISPYSQRFGIRQSLVLIYYLPHPIFLCLRLGIDFICQCGSMFVRRDSNGMVSRKQLLGTVACRVSQTTIGQAKRRGYTV
jgi:hypothetical protein